MNGGTIRQRWAGVALALCLLAACGRERQEPLGAEDWVNPDGATSAEPITLQASQLPYAGAVTAGINYFHIVGLPANTPQYVAVTGKRADADLFVLGNADFSDFACASTRGGAEDDQCLSPPRASGELFVEVYGFTGNDTPFVLDVW